MWLTQLASDECDVYDRSPVLFIFIYATRDRVSVIEFEYAHNGMGLLRC